LSRNIDDLLSKGDLVGTEVAANVGLDFIDGVNDLERSREPDAKKKTKLCDLAACLKAGVKTKRDYDALARAGIELGKSLTALSSVDIDTENLTDRGRDALELNELLKKLENGEQIDFDRLNELTLRAAESDKNTHAPEVTTFDASLDQAAEEISHAFAEHAKKDITLEFAGEHDLAAALRRLAQASRVGNRTQMVIATKTIHALVHSFCTEENKVAAGAKNKVAKDRMTRSTTAMSNLSTQLKILSTVRVVSDSSKDSDEQLINVVKNLSKNFKEALISDEIIKLAK